MMLVVLQQQNNKCKTNGNRSHVLLLPTVDILPSDAFVCLHLLTLSSVLSVAVLNPRVGHNMYVLSPIISVLCHSDWLFHGEYCNVFTLSIQAVRGLPRMRVPGIVPCIISFSKHAPLLLMV